MTHHARYLRRKAIAESVRAGESVAEIVVRHLISTRTVQLACREFGVKSNQKGSAE